ncbi:hypothetical protein [Salsipaludibacter albus]|uniref:hypothetical protein n=1 Tax=Salsipaludibacter albus TaxID=2849650 RepID=UPI001EE4D8DA|nr:hypothetical protein [Salsipaludibacter albus]MBY5164508.1 hypothetical protein [Salsipaludibacter albus]
MSTSATTTSTMPTVRLPRHRLGIALLAVALGVTTLATVGTTSEAAAVEPGPLACDDLDPASCLLPFPNDAFTVADPSTDTRRRLALDPETTPVSQLTGRHVDPPAWNETDGWSPGSPIMTVVPGLDLPRTWGTADEPFSDVGINTPGYFDHRDHLADIDRYEAQDAPIVLLDATTGERHPFWSELDQSSPATAADDLLFLRPSVNLAEGHRYVVALRDLRDADGEVLAAPDAFVAHRDGTATGPRANHLQDVLATLDAAGIARDDLYLAWDFTVASQRSLTEAMLAIRDDAFAQLGDTDLADGRVTGDAPEFTVDTVTELDPDEANGTARRITGTVTVPNYLDLPGGPTTSVFNDPDGDGLPEQLDGDGTLQARFVCHLPEDAAAGRDRATPLLYGHGLLGSPFGELDGGSGRQMRRLNFATCGTLWIGMSNEDVPTVVTLLTDVGGGDVNGDFMNAIGLPDLGTVPSFETVAERSQQGFLNFLFLGRALVHPDGLSSHPAFRVARGNGSGSTPAIRTATANSPSPLVYDGNSQGAIMGGALVALSPDARRGVLGVPGMNYSTLLNRSVDWENEPALAGVFETAYADPVERQVVIALMQVLWDRGETNGYAHHATDDPLPNTPAHDLLLHVAFGDHQVANVAAEVQARTIGAKLMIPALADGLHWETDPYSVPTATYPHRGSAMVYWDSGNATPPNGNVPADHDGDPHEDPRREPGGAHQKARFLTDGIVVDVCDGQPYRTDDHPESGSQPWCTGFPAGAFD